MLPSVISRDFIRNHRRSSAVRKGAAIVEMAIVLPVFMMLILGIIEFGRAMSVSQMVSNASREGCRRAVLDDSQTSTIETEVKDFLSNSLGISTGDVTVECYVNDVLTNVNTAMENDKITVNVEVDANDVSYFAGGYLAGKKLTGETTMRHE
ncbi:MAG: TadE/TadG family type IV pilus assembly protein [Planctomycetaceae bacterium]